LAGGAVYFAGMDGHVYAADALSGEVKWRKSPKDARALQSSTAVVYGTVFVYAAGSVVWKNALGVDHSTAFQGHIMIDGDVLYFPTGRTSPVAVNNTDGSLVNARPFDYRRSGGGVDGTFLAQDIMAYGPNQAGVLNIRVRLDYYPDLSSWIRRMNNGPWGRVTSVHAQTIAADAESVYLLRTYRAGRRFFGANRFSDSVLALNKSRFLEELYNAMDEERPRFPNFGGTWFVSTENKRTVGKLPGVTRWQQEASSQSLTMIAAGNSLIIGGMNFRLWTRSTARIA
jgi:hypothetical protein